MHPKISGPKGAPDVWPPRSAIYESIIATAVSAFRRYGYGRIDTPIFEQTELFERGLASGSDIVTKEMYTFQDKGGRSLTLRPDMTAPVVRSIIEHGLDRAGRPVKLYYVAPIFRHERPQSGRFRQFTQVGVESVGGDAPEMDAEVILLASQVFSRVGLGEVKLLLNSIGHADCRAAYLPLLKAFLQAHSDDLCDDCRRKIDVNPLRTFDCKAPADRRIMLEAPLIKDHLCDDCVGHHSVVKESLSAAGLEFVEEPRLVRGLDYYSRTTFEFVSEGLGAQNAVGAGGRYDGLSEQLGGTRLPGVGFGLGVERIALALDARPGAQSSLPQSGLDVYLVAVGAKARPAVFVLAEQLRSAGLTTDLDLANRGAKGQFKAADRAGAKQVVVIGDRELESGLFTVRDMNTGQEEGVAVDSLAGLLTSRQ